MTTLMATQRQHADDEIRLVYQSLKDANDFAELYRRHVLRVYRYYSQTPAT